MLVILGVLPVASPRESVLLEEADAQVTPLNLVGKRLRPIGIRLRVFGRHQRASSPLADVRIVKRIDVDGHAPAMTREASGTGDKTEVEGGRVVVHHRSLIVGIVLIHQNHALNGIARLVELAEDVEQVVSNVLVADELALQLLPFLIIM